MAARSIASVFLTFGLVSIPVKVYSATQSSSGLAFNLLHKTDGSRLKQQLVCAKENVPVDRADVVKGYEFAKDQYVMFTPAELKALEEKGTHTIEIIAFMPTTAIDPIYYDKAYYLAPDKGGARPYSLLIQSMVQTQRCALAKWAWKGKQYMVQVRPSGEGLVLQQLMYADEVRSMKELGIETSEVKKPELDLAVQLINQIAVDHYDASAYEDEVKRRVEAAVKEKVAGKEIVASEEPETGGGQVIDLMEALRASLGKVPVPELKERKGVKRAEPKEAAAPAARTKTKKSS